MTQDRITTEQLEREWLKWCNMVRNGCCLAWAGALIWLVPITIALMVMNHMSLIDLAVKILAAFK